MEPNSEESGSGRGCNDGVEKRVNLYMCVSVCFVGVFSLQAHFAFLRPSGRCVHII